MTIRTFFNLGYNRNIMAGNDIFSMKMKENKKNSLLIQQKFAIKLLKKGKSDIEVQKKLKSKFGTEISNQDLQRLKTIISLPHKESIFRDLEQLKKKKAFY